MSATDILGVFNLFAHQTIHTIVCTKLCFQAIVRRLFGEFRLVAINALVAPFILLWAHYLASLNVVIFVSL